MNYAYNHGGWSIIQAGGRTGVPNEKNICSYSSCAIIYLFVEDSRGALLSWGAWAELRMWASQGWMQGLWMQRTGGDNRPLKPLTMGGWRPPLLLCRTSTGTQRQSLMNDGWNERFRANVSGYVATMRSWCVFKVLWLLGGFDVFTRRPFETIFPRWWIRSVCDRVSDWLSEWCPVWFCSCVNLCCFWV